jgi:dTDP-4-amino-4,6-dideoxygalactose transaminase
MPIGPLAEVCRRHGIPLVEDGAQSFAGAASVESSESDVVLLSFGPIKTCTALGGAVILLRDREMAGRVERRLSGFPRQPTREYIFRVLKMSLLQALTWPPLFTALCTAMSACGFDWDRLLASLTRGFAGERFWERLRRQPAHPMLGLLERRLASYSSQTIVERARRANLLWNLLGTVERPGTAASAHTHWVLPIVASEPERLVWALRQLGYDATVLASSLVQHSSESCPQDERWNRLVYLPNHPAADPKKLAAAIRASSMPAIDIAST